jgi:hypothetical protein
MFFSKVQRKTRYQRISNDVLRQLPKTSFTHAVQIHKSKDKLSLIELHVFCQAGYIFALKNRRVDLSYGEKVVDARHVLLVLCETSAGLT